MIIPGLHLFTFLPETSLSSFTFCFHKETSNSVKRQKGSAPLLAILHPLPKTSARKWNKNFVDKKKGSDLKYRHRRTDRSSPELT